MTWRVLVGVRMSSVTVSSRRGRIKCDLCGYAFVYTLLCVLTRSVLDVDWSMRLWSVDGDAKNKLKINISWR